MEQIRTTPTIIIASADYERLAALADTRDAPERWPALLDVLDRAQIVPPEALPPATVAIGTELDYRDEATGETRRVVLVFPREEDSAAGRLSVTTPVGTALIGRRQGESAAWQTRSGAWKTLTLTRVARR